MCSLDTPKANYGHQTTITNENKNKREIQINDISTTTRINIDIHYVAL